jgi:predicted trehalose synthase
MAAVLVAAGAFYAPEAFGIGTRTAKIHASLVEMSLGVAIGAHHLHRLGDRLPQAERPHERRADHPAGAPYHQHRRSAAGR